MAMLRTPVFRSLCGNSLTLSLRNAGPQKLWYNKFSGFSPSPKQVPKQKVWQSPSRAIRTVKRRSLTPIDELNGESGGFRSLLRPLGFTVLVSGVSFGTTAIWQYETLRKLVGEYKNGNNKRDNAHKFFGKAGSFRHHINMWWNGLSPGRKLVAGIISINFGVFCLWRVPALQPFMLKYFSASPVSGAPCWSLLLSTFSHYSAFHLAANMYVLWSFAEPICNLLGREQFLATYLTAGMVSGFSSYVLKVARASAVPSIGASGAIMAILGMVCLTYPNAQLSIAFIGDVYPHSFSASSAMKSLIAFDTLGVLLRWRFFDHAAHLGGMLFGLWYIKYGHKVLWGSREPFLKFWHDARGGTPKS